MAKQEKKDEIKDVSVVPVIKNIVDDANALSVTSVGPLPEAADSTEKAVKEEEAPATSEPEKKEEEKEISPDTPPAEKPEPKPKDVVQRRIDEITKKFRTAERERDFERSKRIELEAEVEKLKESAPPTDKPKLEDFESEVEFLEALTDWKVEQKLRVEKEKSLQEKATEQERAAVAEGYDAVDASMEKGREKYSDFEDLVMSENLQISDAMLATVMLSEIAEDILYYLGSHPEESAAIAALEDERQVAFEIGKIEERLKAPPLPKKLPGAPPPITPVRTTGVVEKNPENMTAKEYRAWREGKKR